MNLPPSLQRKGARGMLAANKATKSQFIIKNHRNHSSNPTVIPAEAGIQRARERVNGHTKGGAIIAHHNNHNNHSSSSKIIAIIVQSPPSNDCITAPAGGFG